MTWYPCPIDQLNPHQNKKTARSKVCVTLFLAVFIVIILYVRIIRNFIFSLLSV